MLEILLVVTIIGILASVVVLSATDVGRQRTIRAEAERLALAVELARDEARLRNEIWGLAVDGGSYRFQRYDEAGDRWQDVERREFGTDATEDGIEFSTAPAETSPGAGESEFHATTAGLQGRGGAGIATTAVAVRGERPPDVVIYPGGELTPFEVVVTGGDAYAAWVAQSDGIQRTRAAVETEVVDTRDDLDQWLLDTGLVQ